MFDFKTGKRLAKDSSGCVSGHQMSGMTGARLDFSKTLIISFPHWKFVRDSEVASKTCDLWLPPLFFLSQIAPTPHIVLT